jgi:lipoate-protein ligase A
VNAPLFLWLDGAADAPRQMARDGLLLERAAQRALPGTVLRLFTFDPPGITLGRAQDPAHELDLDALAGARVPWAVRPTGGRAIWHEDEWTFSLVTRLEPGSWAGSSDAAYERTGRLLASAFQRLGVPAVLAPGAAHGPGAPRSQGGAAPPCFASTARHEVLLEGRKLAGIAQRFSHGALLQQGSLLLGDAHERLADFVRTPDRDAVRTELAASAAVAGAWLGADRSLERLAAALVDALGDEVYVTRWNREDGARALALEPHGIASP